jgi:hypothetical protein
MKGSLCGRLNGASQLSDDGRGDRELRAWPARRLITDDELARALMPAWLRIQPSSGRGSMVCDVSLDNSDMKVRAHVRPWAGANGESTSCGSHQGQTLIFCRGPPEAGGNCWRAPSIA